MTEHEALRWKALMQAYQEMLERQAQEKPVVAEVPEPPLVRKVYPWAPTLYDEFLMEKWGIAWS
jgi:hypothetical protein